MTFDFILRAGSTQVKFDLGDISQPGWGNPNAAEVGILICEITLTLGSCCVVVGDVDMPVGSLTGLAHFLRNLTDESAEVFEFEFYDDRIELAMTFTHNRLFDLRGSVHTLSGSDPGYRLQFESHFGSHWYQETLDELDDILCVLSAYNPAQPALVLK